MFALVDCNNFYASCERVFRPDLNGKPIVVLSNNDGCVIARSNEAKALNIPMGAVAFEYESYFKQREVKVFSANFTLYGDMSHRVMSILSEFTPELEIYSIDEAFLDLKGMNINYFDYGQQIRKKVTKNTGIPIGIGIAPTKALGKVANHIAKKFPEKTNGVYVIDSEEKRIKALKWLAIEDVWGIGRKHAQRLKAIGVKNALQFTELSDEWIRKNLSVVGLRLKRDLSGLPTLALEEVLARKNIATTRSFEENYTTFEQLNERICTFSAACAEKLRKQQSCCNAIQVFITSNRHRTDLPQHSQSIVLQLPYSTSSTIELANFATQALLKIYKEGIGYKKGGVIVLDLTPESQSRGNLFEQQDERYVALMKTIDGLNKRFGQQKIRLAVQDQNRIWKMKQEHLSKRYTTNLDDIITIHV